MRRTERSREGGVLSLLLLLGSTPFAATFGFTSGRAAVVPRHHVIVPAALVPPATRLHAHGGFAEGRSAPTPSSPAAKTSSSPSTSPPLPPQRHHKTRLGASRQQSSVLDGAVSSSTTPRRGGAPSSSPLPPAAVLDLIGGGASAEYELQQRMGAAAAAAASMADAHMTPSQVATLLHQAIKDLISPKPGGSTSKREVEFRHGVFHHVRDLVTRAQTLLPHMNPETIATVLNSLSKLPPHLLRDLPTLAGGKASPFWNAFYNRMHIIVPRFGPRCIATVINALAKLRSMVGPSVVPVDRVLIRRLSEQARKQFGTDDGFTTQGLSNVINGFAKLGFFPGRGWLRDFCQEVTNQIDDMGPQAISNVINAFGKLDYRPKNQVLHVLAARAHSILIQFNPQGLANLLNGFAHMAPGFHPGDQFLDDLRDESLWRLAGFESRGLAALAHGFSTFGHHPGELFLDSLGQAMTRAFKGQGHLHDEITGWTVSSVYNGLGKLSWKPSPSAAVFWDATLMWLEKSGGAAKALEPQQVSQVLWSLSAMGPPAEAEALFHHLLRQAVVLVNTGGWDNDKADRQFRQIVLFCHVVGPASLRPAASELRQALEASGRMGTSGGRECCVDSDSEDDKSPAVVPMSSNFHLEVLRCVAQSLGAWDPTTEVDDGVYIQDIVLRSVKLNEEGRMMALEDGEGGEKPLLPIIIEVDGPAHFFTNDIRRPRGDHCLKARILKAQGGWTHGGVVSVAWFEWAGKGKEEKVRMLRTKLEKAIGEEDLGFYIDLSRWSTNGPQQPRQQLPRAENDETTTVTFIEEVIQHHQEEEEDEEEEGLYLDEEDDDDGNIRSRRGLWGLTVVELKSMLRVRGMAVSGRKADLVGRLDASAV